MLTESEQTVARKHWIYLLFGRELYNYINLELWELSYFILSPAKPISKFQSPYLSLSLDIFSRILIGECQIESFNNLNFLFYSCSFPNWLPIISVRFGNSTPSLSGPSLLFLIVFYYTMSIGFSLLIEFFPSLVMVDLHH